MNKYLALVLIVVGFLVNTSVASAIGAENNRVMVSLMEAQPPYQPPGLPNATPTSGNQNLYPPSLGGDTISLDNPLESNTFTELVQGIAYWAFVFSIPLAVIVLIIIGIQFMLSGGDEKKVTAARNNLKWVIVGIVILLLSTVMVSIIKSILGV